MKNSNVLILCTSVSFLSFLLSACDVIQNNSDSDKKVRSSEIRCGSGMGGLPAIIGGTVLGEESTSISKSMALLVHEYKKYDEKTRETVTGSSICTASIIDTNLLLTAAHCVQKTGTWDNKHYVAFTVDPVCNISRTKDYTYVRKVSQVYANSSYSDHAFENDMAMVRIENVVPAGYSAMALNFEVIPFSVDTPVYVAGYGVQTDDEVMSEDMPIYLKAAKVYPTSLQMIGKVGENKFAQVSTLNENSSITLDQSRGEGLCSGDSGGPAMMMTSSGVIKQIGINSYTLGANGKATCLSRSGVMSIYYYRDWIKQAHSYLKTSESQGLRN